MTDHFPDEAGYAGMPAPARSERLAWDEPAPPLDGGDHGPGSPRYERLGATGDQEGLYVRFDPGFGLNVYIGHRKPVYGAGTGRPVSYRDDDGIGMSIGGWERLCEIADEWRS